MIKVVSATQDKVTKNTYRYIIDKNKKGVSGVIYLNKDEYDDPPDKIKIKIKSEED
jgi:hypothetical protein